MKTDNRPKLESVWNSKTFLHISDRSDLGGRLEFFAGQLAGIL